MKNILFIYSPWRMYRERLAGVYRYAKKEKWSVDAVEFGRDTGSFPTLLRFLCPDGCIVDGSVTELKEFSSESFAGVPTVYCDARRSKMKGRYTGVEHDSSETARIAVEELLRLGYGDYAFVGNPFPREWSETRAKTMKRMVVATGHRFHVFDGKSPRGIDGYAVELRRFLAALPKPCGLLAANDATANLVLRICRESRIRVPADIAVIGIDNDVLVCENSVPTLSSVVPDFEYSGYLAAELLDGLFAEPRRRARLVSFGSREVVRRASSIPAVNAETAVRNAQEYIRSGIGEGISARDVVRRMGGSRRHAERTFAAVTGYSIGTEIAAQRIVLAQRLLSGGNVPIAEVCARCGYDCLSTFNRAFLKACGTSPSVWRKTHRK